MGMGLRQDGSTELAGLLRMEHRDLARLEILRQKNADPSWVNGDLYRLMYKTDLYVVAYERLKSNPGNMTPGPDGLTLDGFSMQSIENIIQSMRDESFQFSRARRVHIPKAKGGTRPVGIASPRDKVVQEVMRMIIEAIYESPHGPSFEDSSHGFRPGRGCHTALQAIRNTWSGITWIVEGDVKAAFDNIDHGLLIKALRKRVSDERFLNLVRKALTAGYYEFRTPVNSIVGTPQGSVISPILCNVFLHELDQFCANLCRGLTRGEKRTRNPAYRSIEAKLVHVRKKLRAQPDSERRRELVEELRALNKSLRSLSPIVDDGNFVRVRYVRYADGFIVGVNGPRVIAEGIRHAVADFMDRFLKLTLSLEKTHIRHAKTEEAFFLGTRVKIGSDSPRVRSVKAGTFGTTVKRRTAGWTPKLLAPVSRLVSKLHSKGFCDAEGTPHSRSEWMALDDAQIIEQYNGVLRGLLNYYSFVDNYGAMTRVQYILQFSAAKTLAGKHRSSLRQVFKKHGRRLTVKWKTAKGKDKVTDLKLETEWSNQPTRFVGIGAEWDPDSAILFHIRLRTRTLLEHECAVCGSEDGVQMHHLRHVRKIGQQVTGFNRVLAAVRRKQIPVCRTCHRKIHGGEYDGVRLKDLFNPNFAYPTQ
jgi:group II intron reverse transcriptase/maturase